MPRKNVFPSIRLLCVLGAGLLCASSARATPLTQTIGYDPVMRYEYDPAERSKIGREWDLRSGIYVPFAFDFGGGQYSLDSVQLLLEIYDDASASLFVTSTLGTDQILATFSETGPMSTPEVFTFHADSPSLLTSGSTYYLYMTYDGPGDPKWVSNQWLEGTAPAQGSNPNTSGSPSGGHDPSVTLSPLMTLNPNLLTFRVGNSNTSGIYGISITATAVPEPATFALGVVGLTLGTGLFFRLRRRR